MAILRKFLCWRLRTASEVGFQTVVVTASFAFLLRLLDIIAFGTDFEISMSFRTPWKSHQWEAFLACDIVLAILHIFFIFFSVYMTMQVKRRHFIMYMSLLTNYIYVFMTYVFVEFCFSVFEFSFFGKNTFRLAYVVFLWLYWLVKTVIYILFMVVLYARSEEMEDEMAHELRFSDNKKYNHSYA